MNDAVPIRIISVMWSALLGFVAAWVVWMWIYSIGERVIQDQEHFDYAHTVHIAGIIASLIAGIACALWARRPFLSAFLIHLVTGIGFVLIPLYSWQAGIRNYFVTLAVWTAVTVWAFRKKDRRGQQTA
jgi:xanthine/uracil/vitamin C permease (AzgA family)